MRFTILATFSALLTYCWFLLKVGHARRKFGVEAPKTTGNADFERIFRVQQNTVEQMVLFLPSLWIFGFYVSDMLAGLLGLMMAPLQLVVPICMLLGIGIGALFPLSLVVAQDHLDDPRQTGDLLAFVQGGGYLIAATAPLLAGLLRQYTDDLQLSWLAMAVATLVLMLMAARFAPDSGQFHTRPIRVA